MASPSGSPASHEPSPTRARTSSKLAVGGCSPTDAEVLGQRRVEEVRALLDQSDDPPHVVRPVALQGDAVEKCLAGVGGEEAHEDVGEGRLAGAARPDECDAASGGELQVDPAQRGASGTGVGRPDATQLERVGPRPSGIGRWGSVTAGVASMASKMRPAATRERCRAWVAAGRGETSSKAASGTRASTASSAPLRDPASDGVDAERQGAPAGQPGQRGGEAEPDPGRAGAPPGDGAKLAVGRSNPRHLVGGPAHHHELGCAFDQVDDAGCELAPRRRLLRLGPGGETTGQPRHRRG